MANLKIWKVKKWCEQKGSDDFCVFEEDMM